MNRQTVESEAIKSIGYDDASETLEIEFHSGEIYNYHPVPIEIYTAFMESESKGFFYNHHVKGFHQSYKREFFHNPEHFPPT